MFSFFFKCVVPPKCSRSYTLDDDLITELGNRRLKQSACKLGKSTVLEREPFYTCVVASECKTILRIPQYLAKSLHHRVVM